MNNQLLRVSSLVENSGTKVTTRDAVLIEKAARALRRIRVDDSETHRMVQTLNLEQRLRVSFDMKRGRLLDGLGQFLVDVFGQRIEWL